jgi:LPS O-antigen subunit length determinant protein (WzzB/FepE family)
MTTASWITMILIVGFVWGGFAVLLTKALRKESRRRSDG